MRRIGEFIDRQTESLACASRRLAVIGTPGDRRDEDARELGMIAAQHFDTIVIFEGRHRGRTPGETAAVIESGIRAAAAGNSRCSRVEVVLDQVEACDRVLSLLRPGDVAALCIAETDDVWRLIETRRR